jgi:hypothetical protein
MSTARIRGVDRVYLMANYEPRLYKVTDDMTFGHLIAEACQTDQLTLDLLNNYYLVDQSKGTMHTMMVLFAFPHIQWRFHL